MKQFFVFFLFFAIQFNCGRAFQANQTDILASVREYPSLLHRCTATFVKPDVLLTTARCLYCTGNCKLFVQVFTDHLTSGHNPHWMSGLTSSPQAFSVEDVVIHPDYERYPQRNDIGLIKLKSLVFEATTFKLPSLKMKFHNLLTNTYAWKFSNDLQDYFLHLNPSRTISNAVCSLALNQYVGDTNICVRGKEAFSFGAFDQGAPLVANISGDWFILGMYVREGISRYMKSEIFQAVSPFTDWIKAEIERKNDITNVFTNAIGISPASNIPQGPAAANHSSLPAANPQPSPNIVNVPSSTAVTKPPSPPTPAPTPAPPTPAAVPQTPPPPPAPAVTPEPPAPAPVPETPSAPPAPTPEKPEADIQPNQTTDTKNPQNFRLNEEDSFDGKPLMLSDNFDM